MGSSPLSVARSLSAQNQGEGAPGSGAGDAVAEEASRGTGPLSRQFTQVYDVGRHGGAFLKQT